MSKIDGRPAASDDFSSVFFAENRRKNRGKERKMLPLRPVQRITSDDQMYLLESASFFAVCTDSRRISVQTDKIQPDKAMSWKRFPSGVKMRSRAHMGKKRAICMPGKILLQIVNGDGIMGKSNY